MSNLYTIYNADCAEIMRDMPDGYIDCVITDPPYGINENSKKVASRGKLAVPIDYGDFDWDKGRVDTELIYELRRVSKEQLIWGGNYYTDCLPPSSSWAVWDKMNGTNDFADCELAWTSHKKAVRRFQYLWNGMIKQKPEKRFHPTQKPLELMIWCLETYTKPRSVIFDPFMGSGTTGVACLKTGRIFIGCEINKAYFDAAEQRLIDESYAPTLFEAETEEFIEQLSLLGDEG